MRLHSYSRVLLLWGVGVLVVATAGAQTAPLRFDIVAYALSSGMVENTGSAPATVFAAEVVVPDATWLRLTFDDVQLSGNIAAGTGSFLRITALLDGGVQTLNEVHLRQWRNKTAYFNGDAVLVELVAYPGTGPNALVMSQVQSGLPAILERSICGPTDDRQLSDDPRQGRLQPAGCTGWMIDDCNQCFLTAGHCSGPNDTVEFNVPLSSSDGTLMHPGPEDQYAIDPDSVQSNGGQGIGDDWAYFGCFANPVTGLTPGEAQGAWYSLELPPAVDGQNIRITGYGTVSSPVSATWNQVQKTHVGPYNVFSGTSLGYATDTTGGNSGSPVVVEEAGVAIGIHTHGGCGSDGSNWGTGANHAELQAALANPQGVCIPMHGIRVRPTSDYKPYGDPGGPFTPESFAYIVENLEEDASLDYEITHGASWVTATPASGTLAPLEEIQVVVALAAGAEALPKGEHTDVLNFANVTTGEGNTTRAVVLTVGGPQPVYVWDMNVHPGWAMEGLWAWGPPQGQGGSHGCPDPPWAYTGFSEVGYNLAGDYEASLSPKHVTTGAINCSALTATEVRFYRWLGVESPTYDHAVFSLSTNGSSWTTIWENASEVSDNAWLLVEYDISDYADNQATVYLRWTMGPTDSAWQYCGWNIDDVSIWAFEAPDYVLGDMNCDGVVDFLDINPFALALSSPDGYAAAFPECDRQAADCNDDGFVDFRDINPFVLLIGSGMAK